MDKTSPPGVISFTVYGNPKSKRISEAFFNPKTKKMSKFSPKSSKDWEQLIRSQAQQYRVFDSPWDCAVEMELVFSMPKPKSCPKTRLFPVTKPDLDKLCRAVFDGVTGILVSDDSRIIQCTAWKQYSDAPSVDITIQKMVEE